MPEKKKQHYVPRCLLKQFCNNERKLYAFHLIKNQILPKPIPYSQQCYTNYMYGKELHWENRLSYFEAEAAEIINKIVHSELIESENESSLKNFILYQYFRTERAVDRNENMMEQIITKTIMHISNMEKWSISPNQIPIYAKEYIKKNYSRPIFSTKNLEMAEKSDDMLNDLKFTILKTNKEQFLFSDNPVIIDNLFLTQNGFGIDCVGVIFCMPISPEFAILLYDDKVYDINSIEQNNIIELTGEEVDQINKLLFLHARELLFSKEKSNLKKVKDFFGSKYIDKPLIEIYKMLGMKDPILIGIEIERLKKLHISIVDETIPKCFAQKEDAVFPLLQLKKEFIAYKDNINANFGRHDTLEKLSFKLTFWDKTYGQLVTNYLT